MSEIRGLAKKQFDLVAIGGAPVDAIGHVDMNFIKANGFDHGRGLVIGHAKKDKLIERMAKTTKVRFMPGGVSANTAVALASLGAKTAFQGPVGQDKYGALFIQSLEQFKVNTNAIKKDAKAETQVIVTPITPDKQRSFAAYSGVCETFGPEDLNEEQIKDAKAVFLDGYTLAASKEGFKLTIEAIDYARKHGTKVIFTLANANIIKNHRGHIDRILGCVDLVFMNEDEAKTFSKTPDMKKAIETITNFGIPAVITHGEYGAYIVDSKKKTYKHYPVPKLKIQEIEDQNGAGDAFAGGYIYGWLKGLETEQSVKIGSALARNVLGQDSARVGGDMSRLRPL